MQFIHHLLWNLIIPFILSCVRKSSFFLAYCIVYSIHKNHPSSEPWLARVDSRTCICSQLVSATVMTQNVTGSQKLETWYLLLEAEKHRSTVALTFRDLFCCPCYDLKIKVTTWVYIFQSDRVNLINYATKFWSWLGFELTTFSAFWYLGKHVSHLAFTNISCFMLYCFSCFLMDKSGYIIYHHSYMNNASNFEQHLGGKHITELVRTIPF